MRYTACMCGRYALEAPRSQLSRRFGLDECAEIEARYNIAPSTDIPVVRQTPAGQRVLQLLRWGLVPHWVKHPSNRAPLINARGESLGEKPSFRDAFQRRRCLIPASGFYEWQTSSGGKGSGQACYISLKSGETMAIGGLWESWTSPGGDIVRSCCIITTAANELIFPIHERMPLILAAAHWQAWLTAAPEQAGALIRPYPESEMQAWRVSRRVGQASEDDPGLIEAQDGEPL